MINLDDEQTLIYNKDNSCVINAGPGSGKTRLLTSFGEKLLGLKQQFVLICFTRSAALEMSNRVENLPATTIHSYCCSEVGWENEWGYEGLLYRFLKMPQKQKLDWVLVDEVQDISPIELDVILSIAKDKIFAVGDPFQSIYGFQEALGKKVFDNLKILGCEEVFLKNNYRSCFSVVRDLNLYYNRSLKSKAVKDTGIDAILCRTNDDVFSISKYLKINAVPHIVRLNQTIHTLREFSVFGGKKLIISTIHCSKGHEYDNVFIWNFNPQGDNDEEFRVRYVAMSRASKSFVDVNNLKDLLFKLRRLKHF